MSLVLLASAAAAILLTWAHLAPRALPDPSPIPSLQHVQESRSRRRNRWQLERVALWLLRLLALLAVLAAIALDRSGRGFADRGALVLVDSQTSWEDAKSISGACGWLGFRPRASANSKLESELRSEGDVPAAVVRAARDCSDTEAACLVRAANASDRPIVIASAFAGAWPQALEELRKEFFFQRLPATAPIDRATQAAPIDPAAKAAPANPLAKAPEKIRVRLLAHSRAAKIWAAAIASFEEISLEPAESDRADFDLLDSNESEATERSKKALRVIDRPQEASALHPKAERKETTGMRLADPLDLAAAAPGLGARASLACVPDAGFRSLAGAQLLESIGMPTIVIACADEHDLGRWLHDGTLRQLARLLLGELMHRPIQLQSPPSLSSDVYTSSRSPPAPALSWTDAAGNPAAVGMLDIAPGDYSRSDHRVQLHLERASANASPPLDDAALARLHGSPRTARELARLELPTLLFGGALLLWILGSLLLGRALRALLPALLVALILLGWAANAARSRVVPVEDVALFAGTPKEASALKDSIARAQAKVRLVDHPDCGAADSLQPCRLIAKVAMATNSLAVKSFVPDAPGAGAADALIFSMAEPRIDLLSLGAPAQIPLGAAAEIRATVRARRARGLRVEVTARPSGASRASASFTAESDDEIREVRLPVAPLGAGNLPVAVEARTHSSKGIDAEDARLLSITTREKPLQRLLLAASPSWEARAAEHALEELGPGNIAIDIQLGASVLLARDAPKIEPRALLAKISQREDLDSLILVGFTRADLLGPAAAGLRQFLERGGSVLLLGGTDAAAALGWPELGESHSELPRLLEGSLVDAAASPPFRFRSFAPPGSSSLPLGADVLASLGATAASQQPWLVGRALGRGRLADVTAPELWRLSPPSGAGEAYRAVFSQALSWAEAVHGEPLEQDLQSAKDHPDPQTLTTVAREELRNAAARSHHPFLEADGPDPLAQLWKELPALPGQAVPWRLRRDDRIFALFAALFAIEAWLRRRARSAEQE